MDQFGVFEIINSLGEYGKVQILYNNDFLTKYQIADFYVTRIMISLSDTTKVELLSNKDFIENQLKLNKYKVSSIIESIQDEKLKLQALDIYNLENNQIVSVLETCSDNSKAVSLLDNKYNFRKSDVVFLLSSMDVDTLMTFINEHNEFLDKNSISTYQITVRFDKEKQLEFVEKLENVNLPTNEKRKILATLRQETKDNIDISNYSEEYKTAIEMKVNELDMIVPDLDRNLEQYRGLEDLMYINPIDMTEVDKENLSKLFELFPNLKISNYIDNTSTFEEFKNGEEWIKSVIQQLNPEWTDIQKVAFIDNAIGKKISYSPDFDTEIYDKKGSRAVWKMIDSGYGVCAGIALLEQYILNQIGIQSELVGSNNHAFIMLKNVEITTASGEAIRGDTIVDPTWNLAAHRYGIEPSNFCRSYEEMRKRDIEDDGTDCLAHKNDEKLSSATLDLDKETLRQIYTSIGIADKDGNFPISKLEELSSLFYALNLPEQDSIKNQFLILSKYYPEFATCQNSTMAILREVLLNNENFKYNRCVVNRVYDRKDENKRPILYVYVDFPQAGKKFYFADKDSSQFVELSQKEFEEKFECYDMDMKKNMAIYNCSRPWEAEERKNVVKYVSKSSENMVAKEGDVR